MKSKFIKWLKSVNGSDVYGASLVLIFFSLIASVISLAVVQDKSRSEPWPDSLKKQFLDVCEGKQKPTASKVGLCRCLLGGIVNKGKIPIRSFPESAYDLESHLDAYFKTFQGLMLIQECANRVQEDMFVM
jgi:hypothetical protein